MIPLSIADIAEITGGSLDCVSDPDQRVTGFIEFDSRKVTKGGLFLALPGARVDGHDYAEKAIEQGAVAVLAARPVGVPAVVVKPQGRVTGDAANADIYAHDEDGSAAAVVQALSDIAREVTRRLTAEQGLEIVGVTGSAVAPVYRGGRAIATMLLPRVTVRISVPPTGLSPVPREFWSRIRQRPSESFEMRMRTCP